MIRKMRMLKSQMQIWKWMMMKMNKKLSFLFPRLINNVRRNHALEHATLNILLRNGVSLSGYSDWRGFWVIGKVPTTLLLDSATLALQRLNNGEKELAVHAYCGTNYVASGVSAGLAAWMTMIGANDGKSRWDRLPLALVAATLALMLSRPLGPFLQRKVTTKPEMPEARIMGITLYERWGRQFHRIRTQFPRAG
jgi:hypothetical protein